MSTTINISLAAITGSIFGSGISYLILKTFVVEKIKSGIKHQYDKDIEAFKETLKRQSDKDIETLKGIINSQNHGVQEVQSARIKAIQEFWVNYLVVKKLLDPFLNFDALSDDEFHNIYTSRWEVNDFIQNIFAKISLNDMEKSVESVASIEKIRPFLSEKLWLQFSFLETFCHRVFFNYSLGIDAKHVVHWRKDIANLELIKMNLSSQEYEHIISLERGSTKTLLVIIEQHILQSISEILSGGITVEDSHKNAVKIMALMNAKENK